MSAASHAHPGQLTFGGLLARLVIIVLLWAGLVVGLLHYVGHVLPTEYQLSLARTEAAEKNAHEALNEQVAAPAAPAKAATSAASAPAAMAAAPAPAASAPAASAPAPATVAAPAASAAPATSAPTPAPAPKAATAPKELPKDVRLAGLNRTALTNVAVFYSIVVSICFAGVIILQFFKYCRHAEEEHAH
jgi:hypothetical protein